MQICSSIESEVNALLEGKYVYHAKVKKMPDESLLVSVKSGLRIDKENVSEGRYNLYFYALQSDNTMMPYMMLENAPEHALIRNLMQLNDSSNLAFSAAQMGKIVPPSEEYPMFWRRYE